MSADKRQIEIFFDYACPYCRKAHEHLVQLLPEFPEAEPIWRPCESHPRPESHGLHSDLCIQAMFFAAEHGIDLWIFHNRAYSLMLDTDVNVEDIDALAESLSDLLDADGLRKALTSGKHLSVQQDANEYAFGQSEVWAVPSYRMDVRKLDSIKDIGVTKDQLRNFLEGGA